MSEPLSSVWIVRSRRNGTADDPRARTLDEFPTLIAHEDSTTPDVEQSIWERDDFDYWAFDRSMDARSGDDFHVSVRCSNPERTLEEVVTRCQRLVRRTNAASANTRFDAVLGEHRRLHDLSLPLVRADFDHSLDVWQWVLRLEESASEELQIAALFHDIERLESEATARVEHLSSDYQQFKDAHAARGARIVASVLAGVGYGDAAVARAAALVAGHEHGYDHEEAMLLNEADALSFFSFNSPGFFDYFDQDHCRRKVEYTLRRLGPRGKAILSRIRLRSDVAAMVRRVEDEHVSSSS